MAKFSLGPTFATYHRCKVRGLFANDKTCLNTALHVGFKHEHPKQIYLVKSGRDSSACSPLEVGIFYNHTKLFTVAKLDGFDGTIMPSIGPILAISAGGTRIATAHWKGVLVWAIDPEAFLDPFEDPSVDVKELDSADDSEYASSCGHSFYQVYERVGKAVVIPPVELPNDSVVHKLAFVGEDKLYGLTGHGLVSWDMRVGCAGRQTKRSFDKLNGVDSLVQDA
ncbi:hypothetical protein EV356DRAFT_248654 [Viridothelium virens]|uniref:Uncharacterized protein n=1 Tax=Viridothelium virens TaxID=1048519 RepID=A0A6A6H2Z6_VIRVR|nr:hypothetical protein EV356DRAFT_248654 [Viridothelium virens]